MEQARAHKLADACATPVSAMGQPKRQKDAQQIARRSRQPIKPRDHEHVAGLENCQSCLGGRARHAVVHRAAPECA